MSLKQTSICCGFEQITSLSASAALTIPAVSSNNSSKANVALLQCETQNVRWRDDGTAPTASIGMILYAGADPFPYDGDLTKIRFIETAASAKLNITYLV